MIIIKSFENENTITIYQFLDKPAVIKGINANNAEDVLKDIIYFHASNEKQFMSIACGVLEIVYGEKTCVLV